MARGPHHMTPQMVWAPHQQVEDLMALPYQDQVETLTEVDPTMPHNFMVLVAHLRDLGQGTFMVHLTHIIKIMAHLSQMKEGTMISLIMAWTILKICLPMYQVQTMKN